MVQPLRVLIVRLSALGDVVHGLPVLAALRDALPSAFIGWVVEEKPASSLLERHPDLDRLFVVPRKWMKAPRVVWRLRRELREARFDCVVDLQGLTKSAFAARLSGAACRIGPARPDARELAPWLNNLRVNPDRSAPALPPRLAAALEAARRPRRADAPLRSNAASPEDSPATGNAAADGVADGDAAGVPVIRMADRPGMLPPEPFRPPERAEPRGAVHVVDRGLSLLRPLGIHRPAARFPLPDFEDETRRMDAWLAENGLDRPVNAPDDGAGGSGSGGGGAIVPNGPLVAFAGIGAMATGKGACGRWRFAVVNPGAGWPSKLWPPERYAEVAVRLWKDWRLPSAVAWAGASERGMAEEIVARANEALAGGVAGGAAASGSGEGGNADAAGAYVRILPSTTLPELAALLRRARLFVGSDTGPLHLAVAASCPSVGLFGPMPAERNGPYGPPHAAVQRRRMTGNSRQRRKAGPEAMLAISVDDVATACAEVLRRSTRFGWTL